MFGSSKPFLKPPEIIAAVDLGSNSFHMKIARVVDGQLHVIDRLREMVRLGAGLREDNRLTNAAQSRALRCLHRFGQDHHRATLAQLLLTIASTHSFRRVRGFLF